MKVFGILTAVALFGFGCGSVQDEAKKAPPPAKEECKDAPGKVVVVLTNDAGAPVCAGSADLELDNGSTGSRSVTKLGEIEGAEACGFEFTSNGRADLRTAGFNETKINWTVPGKCETHVIKVTLRK